MLPFPVQKSFDVYQVSHSLQDDGDDDETLTVMIARTTGDSKGNAWCQSGWLSGKSRRK